MNHKEQALSELSLFAGCDRRAITRIATLADEVDVAAGAVIARQGQPGREVFVVRRGWLDVIVAGEIVASIGPGEVAGEIAVLDDGPRTATLRAVGDCRVFVFSPMAFAVVIDGIPPVARAITRTMAARLRESLARTA